MNNLKFIVTGTGRCGTVFMAKLLTLIGIPCGHESIFDYKETSVILEKLKNPELRSNSFCSTHDISTNPSSSLKEWVETKYTIAESSYLAVPFLFHPEIVNIPLIHLVRHPLDVISSFVKDFKYFMNKCPNPKNPYNKKGWENKIYNFLPELEFIDNPVDRACWFYIKWNNEIEKAAKFKKSVFVQIENVDYPKLFNFLEIKQSKKEIILNDREKNSNRKRDKNFEVRNIKSQTIRKLFIEKIDQYYGECNV